MASVLLVGMHGADRREVCSFLNGVGHVVIEAATDEFLPLTDERELDLVVVDISPLMHNVHLIGIMELRRRHPALPILAICCGRDTEALLGFAVQAGATATLARPFGSDQLLCAVARCLPEASP